MNRISLFVAVLCCLALASHAASFADSDSSNPEELAKLVCKVTKGTKHQVGNLASIKGVARFLSGLQDGHKLSGCRNKYLDSLQQLVHVVERASDNVCGDEKLALIEDFHHRFVSKTKKDKKNRKNGSKAPTMVKLFFMQYATEVATACEQSLMDNEPNQRRSYSDKELAQVQKLKKLADFLGMSDLSKGYRSIYLLWNMIDAYNFSEMHKISKYIGSGDKQVRINFQMKDARPFLGMQAVCRYRLKPVYSKTILPVVRLIDLGYYPHGKRLLEGLKSDPSVKNLFYGAQICETLLPVGMFSNDQLAADQIVALTKDEASSLTPPELEGVDKLSEDVPSIHLAPVSIDSNKQRSAETSIEEIKSNVANRIKVVNRLLRHIWSRLKNHLKSAAKSFKIFRKNKEQKLEALDEATLKKLEKDGPVPIEEEEEAEQSGLARRKRGFFKPDPYFENLSGWGKTGVVMMLFFLAFYWIFLYTIKIFLIGLPTAAVMYWYLKGTEDDKLVQFVNWIWILGNPVYYNWGFTPIFDNDSDSDSDIGSDSGSDSDGERW